MFQSIEIQCTKSEYDNLNNNDRCAFNIYCSSTTAYGSMVKDEMDKLINNSQVTIYWLNQ